MATGRYTFGKEEHIVSKIQIDNLFGKGGSRALSAFPIRAVYRLYECPAGDKVGVQVLLSVPKKHLHHAVSRNRVKRQLREAYRLQKQTLHDALPEGLHLDVAFIWLSDQLSDTASVHQRVGNLLSRMAERIVSSKESKNSAGHQQAKR